MVMWKKGFGIDNYNDVYVYCWEICFYDSVFYVCMFVFDMGIMEDLVIGLVVVVFVGVVKFYDGLIVGIYYICIE